MKWPFSGASQFGLCLSLCTAGVAHAGGIFFEDFSTTTYRDDVNTTADWNTAAGELRLHPLPTEVGSVDTPSDAFEVVVAGDRAYVADYLSGVQVFNISDPGNPSLIGSYDTPGQALGLATAGDLLFVADGLSGLVILDVTNPASPTFLGSYDSPGTAQGIAVAGDHLFLADGLSGLQVVDISSPGSPSLIGTYDSPGNAYDVTVDGDYAFVADFGGLRIVDISNPVSPTPVGFYGAQNAVAGVAVSGDLAFVADGSAGLKVLNISNPASPVLLGSVDTPGNASGVEVSGDVVYVADGSSGLWIVDVSNPSTPGLLGNQDTPDTAWRVAPAGELVAVADRISGFHLLQVAVVQTAFRVGGYDTPDEALGVAVAGDVAFVADGFSGLQVIGISDPANPSLLGSVPTPDVAKGIAIAGNYAYVADGSQGLQVIDISNPASPSIVGFLDTPNQANAVAVSGDLAFVADGSSGLRVIDISNPASPSELGNYNTPGNALGVAVSGDYAFVADGGSGLRIVNVSNPNGPFQLGNFVVGTNTCHGVAVSGDLAYVAYGPAGLRVVDISNPNNPSMLGPYSGLDVAYGVWAAGNLVFLATGDTGLKVLDVSDPLNPILVGEYDTTGSSRGVAVAGDLAFVADAGDGLQVIQALQHDVDSGRNEARSLDVDSGADPIQRVRLISTETAGVSWEVTANGGAFWQPVPPGPTWTTFLTQASDLQWRATLEWTAPGVNPTVSDVQVEWIYPYGQILSVQDVPDDQGGWVRVKVRRSTHDFDDEASIPVTGYQIYQRVDGALAAAVAREGVQPARAGLSPFTRDLADPESLRRVGSRDFVVGPVETQGGTFPAGIWEIVGTALATQSDDYLVRVPTTADSSGGGPAWSVYLVTTHTTTPTTWFISAPDSGYSLDNIAPEAPLNLMAAYGTGSGNQLSWSPVPDPDLQYYRIYRDTAPDFTPTPDNLVEATVSTSWLDTAYNGGLVYYKVTAVDDADNESSPASPGAVTSAPIPGLPAAFALHPNAPNPVLAGTTIRYDVPAGGGEVTLEVFDTAGRRVRVLVSGGQTAGTKAIFWDGRDDRGQPAHAGVYFYRLIAPGFSEARKMVLVQ